ncbi:hypothetical protein [Salinimicrobium sp. GXAS 041]|uniref:hypothetical protein n=1 Tax=Salinimicrobium sp. GXAS 041 TaxID=3400806 RepID=UPI003C73D682
MSRAENINAIVWHCSAGFSGIKSIEAFWRRAKHLGGAGWKHKGYHTITELDGTTWYLKDNSAVNGYSLDPEDLNLEYITNGVGGYNSKLINNCLIGGVDSEDYSKAVDTRTPEQKGAIHKVTQLQIKWLADNGKDVTKNLGFYGHREYSKDSNGNGAIEPWERIKECPSWNVITSEYHYLYSSKDRYGKLPYIK